MDGAMIRSCSFALVLTTLACACGSTKYVNVVFRPTDDMNNSRSCYVLIRAVDPKVLGGESYAKAASLVTTTDPSVKATVVVVPGQGKSVKVPWPEQGHIVLQALLETPDRDGWRLMLPDPPPEVFRIRIERHRICALDEQRPATCRQGGR
jgi:hypothetical protein